MDKKRSILLTRSLDENFILKQEINAQFKEDSKYIECPLIKYDNVLFSVEDLKRYEHIVITSKYAACLIRNISCFLPPQKFWVVGAESAQILKDLGAIVQYIAVNVQDLIKNIPSNMYDKTIYLSSNEITLELPCAICRQIIYNVTYAKKLTIRNIMAFEDGIDYILLYSQNVTKTLLALLIKYKLVNKLQGTTIIALSKRIADIIRPYCRNILYCKEPSNHEMIQLLVSYAKASRQ